MFIQADGLENILSSLGIDKKTIGSIYVYRTYYHITEAYANHSM